MGTLYYGDNPDAVSMGEFGYAVEGVPTNVTLVRILSEPTTPNEAATHGEGA